MVTRVDPQEPLLWVDIVVELRKRVKLDSLAYVTIAEFPFVYSSTVHAESIGGPTLDLSPNALRHHYESLEPYDGGFVHRL